MIPGMGQDKTVRGLREARGLTQRDVAQEAGIGERSVRRLECGDMPNVSTLRAVAKVLRVPESDLLLALGRTQKQRPRRRKGAA